MMSEWWDDPTQKTPGEHELKVERLDDDDWEFVYPRLTMTVYDVFEEAIDAWRAGDIEHAEYRYRRLLEDYPEFIDAYHHLAMLLDETGRESEAFALWHHAVQLGLDRLPDPIRSGVGFLRWAMIDNRPFLRAFHGLALQFLEQGDAKKALESFLRILAWNPDDHQGIRVLAVECYFELGRPEDVLRICDLFPEDGLPELLYGRPLALYQISEFNRSREAMTVAMEELPLVAQELIKKSHPKPKGMRMDRVALWSPEQAYAYWKDHGRYWKETRGALDLLREVMGDLPI